jgi:uncharacterized protein (TIGR00299 family) protein
MHERPTTVDERILYFDPVAGAAGDMITAALIDVGADLAAVQAAIASVGEAGLRVGTQIVQKGALRALKYIVEIDEAAAPHHLGPDELLALVARAQTSERARQRAAAIIERVAQAEAHVHGVARSEVHFHELGGLDTIADALGAMVALESLDVARCFTGPLPMTHGIWHMLHGPLPLPGPATLEILARGGLPVVAAPEAMPQDMELVTPTGAAILAEIAQPGLPPLVLERIGYGAGSRDLPVPNVLRAWLGHAIPAHAA